MKTRCLDAHCWDESLRGRVELPDRYGAVLAPAEQELPRGRQSQHLTLYIQPGLSARRN